MKYFFHFLMVVVLLAGCHGDPHQRGLDNKNITQTQQEMFDRDRPFLDKKILLRSRDVLAKNGARDDAVTEPLPDGQGVVAEIALEKKEGTPQQKIEPAEIGFQSIMTTIDPDDQKAKQIDLDFKQANFSNIVEAMFTQYVRWPYELPTDFKDQKVSWMVSGELTRAEFLRVFAAFLERQGYDVVFNKGTFLLHPHQLKEQRLKNEVAAAWHLKHLNAPDTLDLVKQIVSRPQTVQRVPGTDIMSFTGTSRDVMRVDHFLKSTDTAMFAGKSLLIYEPRYLTPEAVVGLLQNMAHFSGGAKASKVEAEVVTGLERVVVIMNDRNTRKNVLQFLNDADRAGGNTARVFFYPLRNQDVGEIQETVSKILPGVLRQTKNVKIVQNPSTNGLVITATPEQYYEIKKLIDRLDYRVPSVLIDATIVEVKLSDDLDYGVEWFLSSRVGKVRGDVNINTVETSVEQASASIGFVSLADSAFATLDLLATETDVRVLSRPRVMVKNQSTATIRSVSVIRVVKGELTSDVQQDGFNIPQRIFEDKSLGVILNVTPRISDDGSVDLKVEVEDSRLAGIDQSSGAAQPKFDVRRVETELVMDDGQTILIGGMIRNRSDSDVRGIPGLKDVPVMGSAFATEDSSFERTELVVFLTPHVVVDQMTARMVSEAISGIKFAHDPAL